MADASGWFASFLSGRPASLVALQVQPHAQGHTHRPKHPYLRDRIGVEHQAQARPCHCGAAGAPLMVPGHHVHQAEQHGPDDIGLAGQLKARGLELERPIQERSPGF